MKILVVGGGRGIGRAIAERAASRGHALGIVARTAAEVDEAVAAIRATGSSAWAFRADVLDPPSIAAAVDGFVREAGGLDALVYSAGRFRGVGSVATVDCEAWWLDAATSLRGFFHAVQASVPTLTASVSGSIIAMIGPGHAGALPGGSGYGMAQAGLARLVETLDLELAAQGVCVYALNPGLSPTRLMNFLLDDPEARTALPRFNEAFAEGKEVGPEVAAEMACWLIETRPRELGGRIVAALLAPEILETRLGRIAGDDLGKLRVT